MTELFAPKGLSGLLYWYLMYPIHGLIFSGMIRKLAEEAEASSGRASGRKAATVTSSDVSWQKDGVVRDAR